MYSKALFYPYINVLESAWITQQLLYLNLLGAIVPSEFIYNPDKLLPYMRDLVEADLIKQIFPCEYVPYKTDFENIFIEYVKKKNLDMP